MISLFLINKNTFRNLLNCFFKSALVFSFLCLLISVKLEVSFEFIVSTSLFLLLLFYSLLLRSFSIFLSLNFMLILLGFLQETLANEVLKIPKELKNFFLIVLFYFK